MLIKLRGGRVNVASAIEPCRSSSQVDIARTLRGVPMPGQRRSAVVGSALVRGGRPVAVVVLLVVAAIATACGSSSKGSAGSASTKPSGATGTTTPANLDKSLGT